MGASFNRTVCGRLFGDDGNAGPNERVWIHVGHDAHDLVDAGRGAEVALRWRRVAREVL